ncbi:MAG: polysaccharide deacetylase family protein [Chitinophagaceae bacterium]|nr:MAG: polysaccharide deacetylase family protein [Chitinophagaceae bacterium]
MNSKTQIYCFHRVSDEFSPAYPPMPVDVFKKVCNYIDRNYLVIPIEEVKKDFSSKKMRAVITFDDAYYDFYENALPILSELKMPAIQHVITHSADTGESFWTQQLNKIIETYYFQKKKLSIPDFNIEVLLNNPAEVKKTAINVYLKLLNLKDKDKYIKEMESGLDEKVSFTKMMNWKEINDCLNYGISIGSHTHTHPTLTELSSEQLHFELQHSKKMILENTNVENCHSIAYPNGRYNEEVNKIAESCGYKFLLTTEAKSVEKSEKENLLPRFDLYNNEWWKLRLRLSAYKLLY